jgi:hypothetical protein
MLLMISRAVNGGTFWYKSENVFIALHQLSARFINLPLRQLGPMPHTIVVLTLIMIIPVALLFFGLTSAVQRMDKSKLFAYTYAALGATVPFASLMTFSILIKPIYVMRYVLPSLPFFLLLLAAGLCELPLLIMTTGFALLLTANVFGTVEYYRVPTKPD